MSREIDPNDLSKDDVEYIRQRPTLRREFIMQGLGDPLSEDYPGLNFDADEESDEESEGDPGPDGEDNTDPVDELPEDQKWSSDNKKAELEAVIEARNKGRLEEDQIKPDGNQKGNLQDALRADDEAIREAAEGEDDEDE